MNWEKTFHYMAMVLGYIGYHIYQLLYLHLVCQELCCCKAVTFSKVEQQWDMLHVWKLATLCMTKNDTYLFCLFLPSASVCKEFCPQGGVPPGQTPSPGQTPLLGRHPSWADTLPWADSPPGQTPLLDRHPSWADTVPGRPPPPHRDGHCSGLYASSWNAFFLPRCSLFKI